MLADGNCRFAFFHAKQNAFFDFDDELVRGFPHKVFKIILIFIDGFVARCKIVRKVYDFVLVHRQDYKVGAAHRAVFRELEVALRAGKLTYIDIRVERVVVD